MITKAGVLLAASLAALLWMSSDARDSRDGRQASRASAASPESPSRSDSLPTPPLATHDSARVALAESPTAGHESSEGLAQGAASNWEDVAPQFAAQMGLNRQTREQLQSELMGGPVDVDLAWLEQRFGAKPGASALYDAQVRALELNLQIAVASGEYLDELDYEVNAALREGRFLRSNREIPAPTELEPLIFMQSARIAEWATQLRLRREDHPRLNHLQERVTQMVDARDLELARMLRGV